METADIVKAIGPDALVTRCSVVTSMGEFIRLPIASGCVTFGALAHLFGSKNLVWQIDDDSDDYSVCAVATWSRQLYYGDESPVKYHLYITTFAAASQSSPNTRGLRSAAC